jgi:pre-rRNA-processing protein TSR4
VRVLRGVRISQVVTKEKKTKPIEAKTQTQLSKPDVKFGESLFGAKSSTSSSSGNPFSTGMSTSSSNPFSTSSTTATNNPFAKSSLQASELAAIPPQSPSSPSDLPRTFASALSLNNDTPTFGPPPPPEPWPQESDLPPTYPLYYLDPDYEELDKIEDLPIPSQTMDLDEGVGSGSQREEKDAYEDKIDKTFQKFADRLAQNPEQVIRYEFKGQPLLYSKTDAVGRLLSGAGRENVQVTTSSGSASRMPRCSNCGAGRVFEVQLTPHAIMELEREESGLDGMEWGTIIFGVCEKDCLQKGVNSGVGYVEEWVGVQWEELGDRR